MVRKCRHKSRRTQTVLHRRLECVDLLEAMEKGTDEFIRTNALPQRYWHGVASNIVPKPNAPPA